jgi:hypothetical protein
MGNTKFSKKQYHATLKLLPLISYSQQIPMAAESRPINFAAFESAKKSFSRAEVWHPYIVGNSRHPVTAKPAGKNPQAIGFFSLGRNGFGFNHEAPNPFRSFAQTAILG